MPQSPRPRVGISACLLGQTVRYDGGHKRDDSLVALAAVIEWVPICPEVESGMPVPRPTLTLVRAAGETRMLSANGADETDRMRAFARARMAALRAHGVLAGYVLKSRSPSCGIQVENGPGLFAAALREAFPDLPIVEEGELASEDARDAFAARVVRAARHAQRP